MLDAETVVGSGTMKVVCSREELTQKLAVVSRGVSTLLETSNQTFHPGTGWATETMRSRCCTSTLADDEIKSGNERRGGSGMATTAGAVTPTRSRDSASRIKPLRPSPPPWSPRQVEAHLGD